MISEKVASNLKNASFIRTMFEEGNRLRKIYGDDKVYDFSLGNPDPEPPESFKKSLREYASGNYHGIHRYMSNAGYPDVRRKVAEYIKKETSLDITHDHIVMTCGAAGGLNVALKTILDPGDEVIVLSPFFVEYLFYIDNHQGKGVIVPCSPVDFQPDAEAISKVINARTKAIIINSPNNPTGVVYREEKLKEIADVLALKEKEYNTTIYVLSDEPYSNIVYDGIKVPSILNVFKNSFVINSFSKSHSVPGERIGYIAVNPEMNDVGLVIDGLNFCNRTLGFVNAPALMQKVIAENLENHVDIKYYQERRDILYNHLTSIGFRCVRPEGAFYLFVKSPIEDDVAFVKHAAKYNLLLVPGSGFHCPGYVRISYCISMDTIKNSLPAFESLAKEFFK